MSATLSAGREGNDVRFTVSDDEGREASILLSPVEASDLIVLLARVCDRIRREPVQTVSAPSFTVLRGGKQ